MSTGLGQPDVPPAARRHRNVPAPSPPVETGPGSGSGTAEHYNPFAHADVLIAANDPEPAIFGGSRPAFTSASGQADTFSAPDHPAEDADNAESEERAQIEAQFDAAATSVEAAMDEVRPEPLTRKRIKQALTRVLAMWPVALLLAFALLWAAAWAVDEFVAVETYVTQQIGITNYANLSPSAQKDLQREYTSLYRSVPVRQKAVDLAQKRDPQLKGGFLENGLALHRNDAISFSADGKMTIRIETIEPENELVRVQALSESFYDYAQDTRRRVAEAKTKRDQTRQQLADVEKKDAELKSRQRALSADAETFIDQERAVGEVRAFVRSSDPNDVLSVVARERLAIMQQRAAELRGKSEEHDAIIAQRMELLHEITRAQDDIAHYTEYIDNFALPERPDPRVLKAVDTRPRQRSIAQIAYISALLLVGGAHYMATQAMARRRPTKHTGRWRKRKRL